MSNDNDNTIVRVFKLWAKISMMVVDGARDPSQVADVLQGILDTPKRSWREEDGVIFFSVTSNGATGKDWITRFEGQGFRVGKNTRDVLLSPDFSPTYGVTTEVAVIKGLSFVYSDRFMNIVYADADQRKLSEPNAEIACLIREKFTDKEIKAMGLECVVAMHEPIKDDNGDPQFLGVICTEGNALLRTFHNNFLQKMYYRSGFAFAVSQTSPQN